MVHQCLEWMIWVSRGAHELRAIFVETNQAPDNSAALAKCVAFLRPPNVGNYNYVRIRVDATERLTNPVAAVFLTKFVTFFNEHLDLLIRELVASQSGWKFSFFDKQVINYLADFDDFAHATLILH